MGRDLGIPRRPLATWFLQRLQVQVLFPTFTLSPFPNHTHTTTTTAAITHTHTWRCVREKGRAGSELALPNLVRAWVRRPLLKQHLGVVPLFVPSIVVYRG